MRIRIMLVALASATVFVVAQSGQAGGSTPITFCEQTVITNAVLTQNMHCPNDGIVVGADHITIDLNGFRIRGDGGSGHEGISDPGFDYVTVKDGTIRGFGDGIFAVGGADHVTVSGVAVTGNTTRGIVVTGDFASVKSSVAAGNGTVGIVLSGEKPSAKGDVASYNGQIGILLQNGGGASVASSTADGNGDGIEIDSDGGSVKSSHADGNQRFGISASGGNLAINGNHLDGNGFAAQAPDMSGQAISILTYPPTAPPKGKNVARGSDDLTDCDPAFLC